MRIYGWKKKIVGKIVKRLYIAGDDHLMFEFEDGTSMYLVTDADCCSESWIEHMSGVSDIIGKEIVRVIDKDLGEVTPTRQEADKLYSTEIEFKHPQGTYQYGNTLFIEYRNSSNGYYGGDLCCYKEPHTNNEWKLLTEDF